MLQEAKRPSSEKREPCERYSFNVMTLRYASFYFMSIWWCSLSRGVQSLKTVVEEVDFFFLFFCTCLRLPASPVGLS